MNFEKPVLSGMFGKTPPREVIKLFDNTCSELERNQLRGEVLSRDNLRDKLHQHGEFDQHVQLNQPGQHHQHGEHSQLHKPGEIIQTVNLTKCSNSHSSEVNNYVRLSHFNKFSDDWQLRDINELIDTIKLNDNTLTDQASQAFAEVSHTFNEGSEVSHTFNQESHTSQIPEAMTHNPLPSTESISKKITKSKTISKPSKENLKKGKNQSLKEEQASIALKFRETISVFENCNGIKMYQCQLCKECSFQFKDRTRL